MDYTIRQKQAIETVDRNLQIIACAGSGKTQVVAARVVEIFKRDEGCRPENIVAFTFTKKAAAELKDRINQLCLEEFGRRVGLADMFVGTIHAYCLHLLQSPPLYEYLKFSVLEDVRHRLFIDRHSRQSGLSSVPFLNGSGRLRRWLDSRLYQQLISILGEAEVDLTKIPPGVKSALEKYEGSMEEKGYLDYTAVIAKAVDKLHPKSGSKPLRKKLRDTLKYLIVDEYQDVNPIQEKLIERLQKLGANLCVVGDDDQTIYQWRGSDVGNIITFGRRYKNVSSVALVKNFRSSKGVIQAATRIIGELPAGGRLEKEMESADMQPFDRGDLLGMNFRNPRQEAEWIASRIRELYGSYYRDRPDSRGRGLTYSDFAVLYRTVRHDAGPLIEVLRRENIPFVVGGMNQLFATAEARAIGDAFFYLADFAPPDGTVPTKRDIINEVMAAGLATDRKRARKAVDFLEDRKNAIGRFMKAELYLQRLFLDFLKELGATEESIPGIDGTGLNRGEVVFFNLGKLSQVISDYENVHFNSAPEDLYPSFAAFLHYQAPGYYPEGWNDAGYAKPDAVSIMTVHQAKGMQWPAVFIPCLRRNRFPMRRQGGRSVWHVIPEDAVEDADRYKGTVEDERRLFYVAMTRAEKYLACSWSPIPGNRQQQNVSIFFNQFTGCPPVLTAAPNIRIRRAEPKARREEVTLALTFSELKYYFDCPYLFKLRFLYGFDEPISRALGYGKSLHDALAEIHSESIEGAVPDPSQAEELVERHLHLPFANREIVENLRGQAVETVGRYIRRNRDMLDRLEHVEKTVELRLNDGIIVNGRIDLIRRTDIDELVIVDFKSDDRAQPEDTTRRQLHIYALGYKEQSGRNADLIEIHNLDEAGANIREPVDEKVIRSTIREVEKAGNALRTNRLPRIAQGSEACRTCSMRGLCQPA